MRRFQPLSKLILLASNQLLIKTRENTIILYSGRFMNPSRTTDNGNVKPEENHSDRHESLTHSTNSRQRPFSKPSMIPGALPASTNKLLRHLDRHDLVLLEGPPGTGKTFTIMNMVIHCLCTGKRLLVVSDQVAATHALTEKIQEYLIGRDRESPQGRHLEALWRMAIKLVDEIPSAGEDLGAWIASLSKMLRVDQVKDLDWPKVPAHASTSIQVIDEQVDVLKRQMKAKLARRTGVIGQSARQVAKEASPRHNGTRY